jgi:AraC family transcriptional regulator
MEWYLCRILPPSSSRDAGVYFVTAQNYYSYNEYLDQTIKLADIAEVLDMSQYYFCQLFKQSMGITPHQYLVQCRLDKAKQLLANPDLAIADIALECGFASQSHLT